MKAEDKVKEPSWWANYKKANPKDKDEYNPKVHCCKRFWKDWCDCIKEVTKKWKKDKKMYKKYKL